MEISKENSKNGKLVLCSKSRLHCYECSQICIKAVETTCCGYLFCSKCVESCDEFSVCRRCGAADCTYRPCVTLRRWMGSMQVACLHCSEKFSVASMLDHEGKCPRQKKRYYRNRRTTQDREADAISFSEWMLARDKEVGEEPSLESSDLPYSAVPDDEAIGAFVRRRCGFTFSSLPLSPQSAFKRRTHCMCTCCVDPVVVEPIPPSVTQFDCMAMPREPLPPVTAEMMACCGSQL